MAKGTLKDQWVCHLDVILLKFNTELLGFLPELINRITPFLDESKQISENNLSQIDWDKEILCPKQTYQ